MSNPIFNASIGTIFQPAHNRPGWIFVQPPGSIEGFCIPLCDLMQFSRFIESIIPDEIEIVGTQMCYGDLKAFQQAIREPR